MQRGKPNSWLEGNCTQGKPLSAKLVILGASITFFGRPSIFPFHSLEASE